MNRAITELCQLSDSQLFDEVATGIDHIIEVVNSLDGTAQSLSQAGDKYPARILGNLAEEEASKVLILMDVIRCPRDHQYERSRLLRYFYNHLSKGIYAEVCTLSGVLTFGELTQYIDNERKAFYLDGPTDVDWIFPNQIIQRREDDLYVNYVQEDGGEGQRYWTSPSKSAANSLFPYHELPPGIVSIVIALHAVGATSPSGLAAVAKIWRPIQMTDEFHVDQLRELNQKNLTTLANKDILRGDSDDASNTIYQRWPFPLYTLDLNKLEVDRQDLKEIQRNWSPD